MHCLFQDQNTTIVYRISALWSEILPSMALGVRDGLSLSHCTPQTRYFLKDIFVQVGLSAGRPNEPGYGDQTGKPQHSLSGLSCKRGFPDHEEQDS